MRKHGLLFLLLFLVCGTAFAQGILKKLSENKTIGNVLDGTPAISTNFKDVNTKGMLPPDFGEDKTYRQLREMPRDEDGNYILTPGFYESTNYSYCLKAGTPAPNTSDAYGLAYLEGKMADIVEAILVKSQALWQGKSTDKDKGLLQNAANTLTEIHQKDVQILLWAIIAKANFSNLQGRTKAVAVALLTPEQIVKLNGGAVKTAANFASDKGIIDKPEPVRKLEEALNSIRSLCYKADATYEDFERAAILTGLSGAPQISPTNTWFKQEDGDFYMRFKPEGYPRTTFQVYVPEKKDKVKFKATRIVATPDDSRQRLAQTDWYADIKPYGGKYPTVAAAGTK